MSHPPGDNGVNVSRVTDTQCHQVGIQSSDALKSQSDVTSRGEVQEVRGQIVGTRSPVNQRGVDLRDRQVERATGQRES